MPNLNHLFINPLYLCLMWDHTPAAIGRVVNFLWFNVFALCHFAGRSYLEVIFISLKSMVEFNNEDSNTFVVLCSLSDAFRTGRVMHSSGAAKVGRAVGGDNASRLGDFRESIFLFAISIDTERVELAN